MKTGNAGKLVNNKNILGGLLMLAIGLGVCIHATRYSLGSLRHMGPGFFPMALGVILACTGLLILLSGLRADTGADTSADTGTSTSTGQHGLAWQPQWRGWACICASLVGFVIIGTYFGLAPATFATVVIAALGDRENTITAVLLLATGMVLICLIVFWWLLQVQFPLFKWPFA